MRLRLAAWLPSLSTPGRQVVRSGTPPGECRRLPGATTKCRTAPPSPERPAEECGLSCRRSRGSPVERSEQPVIVIGNRSRLSLAQYLDRQGRQFLDILFEKHDVATAWAT